MAVSAGVSVQHVPRPRNQKIGAPERPGRNAARHLAASQGHVWQAKAGTAGATAHTGVGAAIDARGDLIRGVIRANEAAARAALRRGDTRTAGALLDANIGLWTQYEELDGYEDHHRAEGGRQAGTALSHLDASAAIHAVLLAAAAPRGAEEDKYEYD